MTVHIHIYEGDNGPIQPRPPIQRPPAPRPPMPVPTGEAGKTPLDNLAKAERDMQAKKIQELEHECEAFKERFNVQRTWLIALARQISGKGDQLGAMLCEELEQMGSQAQDMDMMSVIATTYEDYKRLGNDRQAPD